MRILIASTADLIQPSGISQQLRTILPPVLALNHTVILLLWRITGVRPAMTAWPSTKFLSKSSDVITAATARYHISDLLSHITIANADTLAHPKLQLMPSPYTTYPADVRIDHINRIVAKYHIDALWMLQDASTAINYDRQTKFLVPSLIWTPVYHEPPHPNLRKAKNIFDHVLTVKTLPPSSPLSASIGGRRSARKRARTLRSLGKDETVCLLVPGPDFQSGGYHAACIASLAFERMALTMGTTKSKLVLWVQGLPHTEHYLLEMLGQIASPASFESGRIRVCGALLKPAQMQELYAMADVTIECRKATGLATVARESLACGTPVVATKVGYFRDIFGDAAVEPAQRLFIGSANGFAVLPSVDGTAKAIAQALGRDNKSATVKHTAPAEFVDVLLQPSNIQSTNLNA